METAAVIFDRRGSLSFHLHIYNVQPWLLPTVLCTSQWNAYIIYFQTLMAPSLLVDIRSLWFNLTEDKERIESRWQPAESVAAAARTAFPVNLVTKGRLFASCLPKNNKVLKQSKKIISLVDNSLQLKLHGTSDLLWIWGRFFFLQYINLEPISSDGKNLNPQTCYLMIS